MDVRGDFLVIGSGIAGLRAALTLAEAGGRVVLTKTDATESNTGYAQGGIAAALGADDSPELHGRDTLAPAVGIASARGEPRVSLSLGLSQSRRYTLKRHVADVFTRA